MLEGCQNLQLLSRCHNLQLLSLEIINLPTDATIYEDGKANSQQMKQSTDQDATKDDNKCYSQEMKQNVTDQQMINESINY